MRPINTPSRTSPFFWNEEVRPGLRVAFTSSAAGNLGLHVGDDPDGVRDNRRNLEDAMDIARGSLRFMSQTHSDRVVVVPDPPDADGTTGTTAPDADGMISLDGTEPLAVLVADCVPVVLAATGSTTGTSGSTSAPGAPDALGTGGIRSTAVVHAGRAGVANGIVVKAVAALRREGAEEVAAWIGPSVCGSCYEVPEAMMLDITRTLPEAAARTRHGSAALDLPAAVRRQLLDAGVMVEQVSGQGPLCTLENDALYSHRREPGAGRIAGVVWRT